MASSAHRSSYSLPTTADLRGEVLLGTTECKQGGGGVLLGSSSGSDHSPAQALKLMLRELCDLESRHRYQASPSSSSSSSSSFSSLTTSSSNLGSRPSSPVADVDELGSPSSPMSPSTSSPSHSPALESPRSSSSSSSSSSSCSSMSPKKTISKKHASRQSSLARRRAYTCSGCGATESSQWRNGPDGTKICNPCGMKFWRLKRKMMKRQNEEKTRAASPSVADLARRQSHPVAQPHSLRLTEQLLTSSPLNGRTGSAPQLVFGDLHQRQAAHVPQALQQLYSPLYHQPLRMFENQQHDEEVTAAGLLMQRFRTASFSSLALRPPSTSPTSLLSSPSTSPTPPLLLQQLPCSADEGDDSSAISPRKRSSIYDLLN